MDIEKLTKGELITAAILISFVTAILTGAVIMFLSEDAPKDVIRVSERIITTDTSTSSDSSTDTADTTAESTEISRDDILAAATEAVVRVTAEMVTPRAGVLFRHGGQMLVITTAGDLSSDPQALFQDGVVADLSPSAEIESFSVLSMVQASGPISPLAVSKLEPKANSSLFLVPLSELPEIVSVEVTSVEGEAIHTAAASVPAVSLLLDSQGGLVGVYSAEIGAFQSISTFTAQ